MRRQRGAAEWHDGMPDSAWARRRNFKGIHAFCGSAQHMRQPEQRAAAVTSAAAQVRAIVQQLKAAGFPCPIITGGGTGTYYYEADSALYTEVQPGSYVLMDTDYADNKQEFGNVSLRYTLFGLCAVINTQPGRAVLDGGLKAFAVNQSLPHIELRGWSIKKLSDEHIYRCAGARCGAPAGGKVRIIPSHCDPTVNLHDWLVAIRGDKVQHT
jgi:D-serine deaminase-like pyridoxal phosphate-dependent protein